MQQRVPAGSLISHYEIASRLGAGGMGEVYLAKDRILDRQVAIKFLAEQTDEPDSARERFLREARAAARLSHPNVCGVYEVGEEANHIFIVMQYVEGETIAERIRRAGPLAPARVLAIGLDAAHALSEAHAMSVIHRDIKSQNIMIDQRGHAIVLDFGLAKLTHSDREADLTRTDAVTGTVPYMSPEQLRGQPLDGRTDLFSLGIVLYEALTGRRPFDGTSTAQVITSILNDEPPPIANVSGEPAMTLYPIILRCLAKDREARYASAQDLITDLWALRGTGSVSAAALPVVDQGLVETKREISSPATVSGTRRPRRRKTIESLAVLPFETASASPDAEYLSEGITETLIADLSRLPKLRVMARSTVFRYRGAHLDASQVGRELGVRAVLSGRVQLLGDRFVVRVELVEVEDGSVLWSEQFTRRQADILDLQEEIAREISSTLRPRLTASQRKRVTDRKTQDPEAYQRYLRGVHFFNRRDIESMRRATASFHEAIEADPTFAAPYCGLAETYIYFGFLEVQPPREVFPAARAAALKALELDPGFAEAHAALGWMKVTHEWDWAGAERELTEAVRLNPNCAMAHHWHGLLLSYTRRFDEALPKILHAQRLDPLAPIVNTLVGTAAWHRGDYEEALRIYDQVAELAPGFVPLHLYRGLTYQAAGRYEEAREDFAAVLERAPDETLLLAALGNCLGEMGRRAEAEAILERLEKRRESTYTSAYGLALVHAGIGDREAAYRWLDEAWEERAAWLCTSYVDTRWDSFREEPRFQALMRRMEFSGA